MKNLAIAHTLSFLLAVWLSSYANLSLAEALSDDPYLLQPGDQLIITVWKEKELQFKTLIRPDGGISFPLVGDIMAAGQSVPTLNAAITERLKKFIPDPVVTVVASELTGNVIYVIGKVNRPGNYPINRRVDVVQALSLAGGMNSFAAVNDISILRREGGKLTAIPFRYADIEKGKRLGQNILLKSGDTVVVP